MFTLIKGVFQLIAFTIKTVIQIIALPFKILGAMGEGALSVLLFPVTIIGSILSMLSGKSNGQAGSSRKQREDKAAWEKKDRKNREIHAQELYNEKYHN